MNNGHIKTPEVSTPAPQFTLPDTQGKQVSLSSHEGSWVVLVFYRGSWCPMCNIQLKNLANDYSQFQELNGEVIAVSSDTPEGAVQIRDKSSAPFPILLDKDNTATKSYGLLTEKREWKDLPALVHGKKGGTYAVPAVFLIDPQGVVRYSYVGQSFKDRASSEELLKTLRQLQLNRQKKATVQRLEVQAGHP